MVTNDTATWEKELKTCICTIAQLKEYLALTPEEGKRLQKVIERHPMSITRYYMSLIDKNDPNDPIRKMIVPSEKEMNISGSYDTSGEEENTKMPGLQHKHSQTALILATNRCTAYCRYCFRKRMVGLSNEETLRRFNNAIKYIETHKEINNVLISGGDALILPTTVIAKFLERLSAVSHLDFIRLGSKIPVVFPDRLVEDKELLALLKNISTKSKKIYVVTQFNHPKEITKKSAAAVDALIHSAVIVNNQTVLMRGVNDNPQILAQLQNRLVSIGVNPYYVFQCRPVKRVKSEFQIPLCEGYEIVEKAKALLNGHSKRFKYMMSHKTGKIEIVGITDDYIYFKYHQAKAAKNTGRFFRRKLNKTGGWLDDFEEAAHSSFFDWISSLFGSN